MTGIIVFVLTGISVFLAPILKVKHPPLPHPCSAGGWGGFFPPPPFGPRHLSPSPAVSCRLPWGKGRVFPCPQYIPMPVLYGVFLYMGVASLNGIQVSTPPLLPRSGPHT